MSDESGDARTKVDATHSLMARGAALHKEGRLDEAADVYKEILLELPHDFDATHLLGVIALQQGRFDVAQRLINSALAINPHDASAMGNLGASYMRAGQIEAALNCFEISLRLQPDSSIALINVATALHNMGRYVDAIPLLRKAYEADSKSYSVCNLLGACVIKMGDVREAVRLFEAATRARPDDAEGWANLSVALNAIGEHAKARECADQAVLLKPQSATALCALGAAQFEQGRLTEAVETYRQGVSLPGPSSQMLASYANALLASGLHEEAISQLQRAVKLEGKNLTFRWAIAIAQLKAIYGSESEIATSRVEFAKSMDEVEAWYESSDGIPDAFDCVGVNQPFYLAYQPFNNRELLKRYGALCETWMATLHVHSDYDACESISGAHEERKNKIRIGVASAHISHHSVWNAITRGWIDNIDQTKFDIYLFHLGRTSDQETEYAKLSVTHFEDRPTNVSGWAHAIISAKLDFLIYPEIGMDPLTLKLASLRLAPVQAAAWGHPETTGLPTMDLYLSADGLEPTNAACNYSEKLIRLPNLGVYVQPLATRVLDVDLRSLNLPSDAPLLLCPGAPFKYSPLYDDVWVLIAKQLTKRFMRVGSGGRLVFFRSRSESMDRMLENRLRAAFDKAGVDFDRQVSIIPTLDRPRFFGLMRKSALMLDTLGFSGFNTALQAIECDLPVLAFEGEFMRGRLASAIMRRLDMPELVATSEEAFVERTVALARDSNRREKMRAMIIARRKVLFHDLATVRALERHVTEAVIEARTR